MKAKTAPNVHETVLELLKNRKGKLLDVGAGEGALAFSLINKGFEIRACDINPKQFKLKGVVCDKIDANLKFPHLDKSFDIVTCTEVIKHTENPWNLICEIYRVLKKNGTLILTTPNVENWYSRILYFLTTKLAHFQNEKNYKITGHIEPIFSWKLKLLIENKFVVEKIKYNRSIIPLLHINIPIKNRFFGDIIIIKLRKI